MKIYAISPIFKVREQGGIYSKYLLLEGLKNKGHNVFEFNSISDLKRAIKSSKPDIILHFNIKWLIKAYNLSKKYTIPFVPVINSYLTSITSTHVIFNRLNKNKFGNSYINATIYTELLATLYDTRFNYLKRFFLLFTVPYRYYRMKKRLLVLNKVSRIIVVGKTIKEFLIRHGVNNKIDIIIGPVENCFLGINKPAKLKQILVVANDYIKGLHIALEAFKKAKIDNVKLLAMADNFTRKIITPYLNDPSIEFSDYVPYEKMKEVYKNAYITLFPSLWFEPSGRVWEESVTTGCPIIAFNNRGGASDFLEDGKTALLVGYNVNSWVQAIEKLINNTKLRDSLSKECITFAKDNLVVDAILPKFIKVIEKVCKDVHRKTK